MLYGIDCTLDDVLDDMIVDMLCRLLNRTMQQISTSSTEQIGMVPNRQMGMA